MNKLDLEINMEINNVNELEEVVQVGKSALKEECNCTCTLKVNVNP